MMLTCIKWSLQGLAVGCVAVTLCLGGGPAWAAEKGSAERPNIVIFYADDLGYGDTEPYGQTKIRTPNVARLASEGMKFTQHYTGAPVCAPARCMLLTGLHAGHSPIRGNLEFGGYTDETERGQMPLPPHSQTVARILQEAGYATACVGKWGMGVTETSGHPNRQGFDYFFGYLDQKQAHNYYPTHLWENDQRYALGNEFVFIHENRGRVNSEPDFARYYQQDHAVDHITSKGLKFIEANREGPFFLYFATPVPHASLQAKEEFMAPYREIFEEEGPYLGDRGYAALEHPRAAHAGLITMMDAQLGAILDKLDELGLAENTLVYFSSDNGHTDREGGADPEFFNSGGGLRGFKKSVYEGGIRIPAIVRWPGRVKAGASTELASAQYDVLATVCDVTGTTAAAPMDGISFLPTLLGRETDQQGRDYFYWEYPQAGGQLAVRRGDWKAVKRDVRNNPDGAWELYNLKTDLSELNNVAETNPAIVNELARLADEAHWHPPVREWEFVDPVD